METLAEKGCRCTGIEPVAGQRELLHRRGAFAVVPSIEAVPDPGAQFDAILAIDSLYYMPGPPAAHLGRLARLLKPDGVLIMRIANRAPAIRFVRMLGRPVTDDLFGDALFCFSDRGMRILIRASGLSLESWHACEHKQIPAGDVRGYVLNRILPATTALTGLKMSPGLTYVCRSSR
jgi:SAM-dependent methyltransferase